MAATADNVGKYFEVRYFLNVMVSSTHTSVSEASFMLSLTCLRKMVTVQLPIVLIHMVGAKS